MIASMTTPLTPLERIKLEQLLAKMGDAPVSERARQAQAQQEERARKLRKQQEELAKQEAAAAQRLVALQCRLDEVTTELHSLLEQQARNVRGHVYRDNEAARRTLRRTAERIRAKLPELAQRSGSDPDFEAGLLMLLQEQFPTLFEKDADDER